MIVDQKVIKNGGGAGLRIWWAPHPNQGGGLRAIRGSITTRCMGDSVSDLLFQTLTLLGVGGLHQL